jgi:hypothetical protein
LLRAVVQVALAAGQVGGLGLFAGRLGLLDAGQTLADRGGTGGQEQAGQPDLGLGTDPDQRDEQNQANDADDDIDVDRFEGPNIQPGRASDSKTPVVQISGALASPIPPSSTAKVNRLSTQSRMAPGRA